MQDFIKSNPVSDESLKAEYERIKATITGTEYKARHILVEKEGEAGGIIARLKKDPGSFAKLAAEKSKDPGSKANGGDLGWFPRGKLVAKELEDAEYLLNQGGGLISPKLIENAKKLKLIQTGGQDVGLLLVEAALKKGIYVANAGGANAIAVSEFTVLLMLMCLRRVLQFNTPRFTPRPPFLRLYPLPCRAVGTAGAYRR